MTADADRSSGSLLPAATIKRVGLGHRFELETLLSVEKCRSVMAAETGAEALAFDHLRVRHTEFLGRVTNDGFDVRLSDPHNSWSPRLVGEFHRHSEGTRVKVRSSMRTSLAIFMSVWLTFMALAVLMSLFFPDNDGDDLLVVFGGLAMFALGVASVIVGPRKRTREARDKLAVLLEAFRWVQAPAVTDDPW